jgi:hypothetical protein
MVAALVGVALLASAAAAEAYVARPGLPYYGRRYYAPRLPRYYLPPVLPAPAPLFRSPYDPPYPYVLPYAPPSSADPAPVGTGGAGFIAGETICSRIAQDPPAYVPNPALWHTRPDLPGYRCITMP